MKATLIQLSAANYAQRFLTEILALKNNKITKQLLHKLDTASYSVIAYDAIDWSDSIDFRYSPPYDNGQWLNDACKTNPVVAEAGIKACFLDMLQTRLSGNPSGVVVCLNSTDSASLFGSMTTRESSVFFDDEQVYYYLRANDTNRDKLETLLVESDALDFLGVASSLEMQQADPNRDNLTEIGNNAELIFTSIFDGEGYLLATTRD
jgi:hypothetical protein